VRPLFVMAALWVIGAVRHCAGPCQGRPQHYTGGFETNRCGCFGSAYGAVRIGDARASRQCRVSADGR